MFIVRNITLLFSTLLTLFLLVTNHKISIKEDFIFEIKQGASLQEVTNELATNDLIVSNLFFKLNAKIHNIDQTIKAGEYLLSKSESTFTLQRKFIEGDVFYRKLQLLEGRKVLIPFVKEIVPVIKIKEGWLQVTPPPGLLDL